MEGIKDLFNSVMTIGLAIVGIAILAVLVSRNSQTPAVIGAATQGFAADIGAAVSPVTGSSIMGFTGGFAPSYSSSGVN